ncbi:hypothetical protein EGI22_23730 [Lacihabitans sp. LS3-19]|uniref:hypothetical protein n=1 Tax=Lacihabitans sp. LS3-19 TaxID=2487335 RepID=UPI0020CC8AB0|nr:hypothetical protein [Lacihabitans sp. LS3-19]MCP9770926.1 hypothetical protein [Lacihabitans sp. LS3-19]
MKTPKKIFSIIFAFLAFSCETTETVDPNPLSTNPSDCKISKIYFGANKSSDYDSFSFNADGTVSQIKNLESGKVILTTDFTYNNGILSSQKNSSIELKYSYTNGDLSNVQLQDAYGTKIGDFKVNLNSSKQVSKLTIASPNATYALFDGASSNFTYDTDGNVSLIEIKASNGLLLSKVEYGGFVKIRSHYTTLKGLIFDQFTNPIDFFRFPLVYKYSNNAPTTFKYSTILDGNNMPTSSMTVIQDEEYSRTANESGLQIQRKTIRSNVGNSGSNFYEYDFCK